MGSEDPGRHTDTDTDTGTDTRDCKQLCAVSSGKMPCPFLSRLPSQFVKNYSGKLLKTYGDHCPVVSQGVTQSLAAPVPAPKEPLQSKCPVAGANFQTNGAKNSPLLMRSMPWVCMAGRAQGLVKGMEL